MVTLIPLPIIPIRTDAPIINAVQVQPNAANLTQSVNDVQQLLETAAIRGDGGRGGSGLRGRMRRLLQALLQAADDLEDETESPPARLWYPPTAFAISRLFIQARMGFLEAIERHARIGLLALRPLDNALRLNEELERLAVAETVPGVGELNGVEGLIRSLLDGVANNLDLATRYGEDIRRERVVSWQEAEKLMAIEAREPEQDDALRRLIGSPAHHGEDGTPLHIDDVVAGRIGALSEYASLFRRMVQTYSGFREEIERMVNGNFAAGVMANGELVGELTGKPAGTPLLDCRDIAFKGEQRRMKLRMAELAILRDVITVEVALRGEPETPRHLRTYARTEGLVVHLQRTEPVEKML